MGSVHTEGGPCEMGLTFDKSWRLCTTWVFGVSVYVLWREFTCSTRTCIQPSWVLCCHWMSNTARRTKTKFQKLFIPIEKAICLKNKPSNFTIKLPNLWLSYTKCIHILKIVPNNRVRCKGKYITQSCCSSFLCRRRMCWGSKALVKWQSSFLPWRMNTWGYPWDPSRWAISIDLVLWCNYLILTEGHC